MEKDWQPHKNAVISFQHKSLITRELELKAYDENHLYSIIQEEFNKYQTDLKEEYDYDFKIQSHIEESGIYLTKAAGISKKLIENILIKSCA